MKLGVIGGSGVYDIDGLEKAEWRHVASPWGQPSDNLLFGQLQGVEVVFLPRHGRGHALSPSGINYRANIDALKRCGVTDILSVSACGSFRETMPPVLLSLWINSSTAPLPGKKAFLVMVWSPMYPWRNRYAAV